MAKKPKLDLEHHILTLWTTSKLPIDVVTVRVTSEAPKEDVEKCLDKMTVEGTLDMHNDDAGKLSWTVEGVPRSASGPETIAQWHMLDRVRRDVAKQDARDTAREATGLVPADGSKSVVLSTALSFFFGGFGLLYSAPIPVAIGVILAQVLMTAVLPHSLVAWIYGGLLPLTAVAGAAYALTHNKHGRRTGLRDAFAPPSKQLPPKSR